MIFKRSELFQEKGKYSKVLKIYQLLVIKVNTDIIAQIGALKWSKENKMRQFHMKRKSEQDLSPGLTQAKIRPQQFAWVLLITQNAHNIDISGKIFSKKWRKITAVITFFSPKVNFPNISLQPCAKKTAHHSLSYTCLHAAPGEKSILLR